MDRADVATYPRLDIERIELVEANRWIEVVVHRQLDVGDAEWFPLIAAAKQDAVEAEVLRDVLVFLLIAGVVAERPPRLVDHVPRVRGVDAAGRCRRELGES